MRQIVASNQSGVLPVARVVGNDYLYVWSRTISGLQQHYKTTTWSNFLLSRDDNPYSRSNEKSFYIYAENCNFCKRDGKIDWTPPIASRPGNIILCPGLGIAPKTVKLKVQQNFVGRVSFAFFPCLHLL